MGVFEHVAAFISIILGLAVADILLSLHRLLRARRRVRWDWIPLTAAVVVLMLLVRFWWASYQPEQHRETVGAFLPDMVELILLFLLASAALPDEVDAEGVNLKRYYDENAPYFWTLFTLAFAWSTGQSAWPTLTQTPELLPKLAVQLAPDLIVMALIASLVFVRRRWWNGLVVLVTLIGPVGWLSRSLG